MFQVFRDIWTEFVELLHELVAASNRKAVLATLAIVGLGGVAVWYGLTHIDSRQAMDGVIRMECRGGEYSDA
ncbi:MAG: hypothetical protein HGA47_15405, partial [Zoogloea sp.]|nr:hypothetical protein [Zoogloea sp.]